MNAFKQRVLFTLIATVVATVCGILGGYLLGNLTTIALTERRLDEGVSIVSKDSDHYLAESHAVLSAMNAAPYAHCTEQELTYFRALLFESKHLKDAGRIRDGHIDCSAALDRLPEPRPLPNPDFLLGDGTSIYRDLPLYQEEDETVITLQSGNSFVVFQPATLVQLGPSNFLFAESVVDAPTHNIGWLRGDALKIDPEVLTTDGHARFGQMLYSTHCSSRGLSCVTGYVSIHDALKAEQLQRVIYMIFSGLACGIFGMIVSIFYRRSHGLEHQLHRAVQNDNLQVVYQPVVDLETRHIIGAEALVRWTDEDGFVISPDVFVKIAEERGFISDITRLVLRHALADMGDILRESHTFRLNINITATDLADPRFLPLLERSLAEAQIPTRNLGIEITESGTARQQVAMDAILQLRRRGHRVYIDDFGTGYSSLAYLQDLSVDAIKIDRAFTKAIGTESVTVSILPQIMAMADALNLQVVVEGIETAEQARYFANREKHVFAQGWLFGYPFPSDEFHTLLIENGRDPIPPPRAD